MGPIQKLVDFGVNIDLKALANQSPELQGTEEKLQELTKFIKPKIYWRDMAISSITPTGIFFNQGEFYIDSAYVATGLKNCQKAILLGATIDNSLPQYAQQCLVDGKYYEATLADSLGSYAIENVVEGFHQYLNGRYLPKGFFSTLRFSPGYGDWLLNDQRKILAYLEIEETIKVSDNFLLEPVKSITALIGWSTLPQTTDYPYGKKKKGFCHGSKSCSYCNTWACMK